MNKFLKEFKDRGFFYQCTSEEDLSNLLDKKKISDISIESENLLEIIAFNKKDEDTLNYYIEFLEGKTLEQIILKEESIDYHEVKKIILQICNGLKSLHDQDILHRDIKPANIIIDDTKGPVLIDFGLAKCYKSSDGEHIPFRDGKNLTGTARYASLNTHIGYE